MKGLLKYVLGAATTIVVLSQTPAYAQLRQTHSAEAAQQGSVSVVVWPGSGTNIDFSGLGERVYRIWLDDPSRITVDTDSALDESGAQVIHLRRIEGVNFAGLPATAQTLLTVATINGAGQTTLYQFPVSYRSGTPTYSTIALEPTAEPIAPEQPVVIPVSGGVSVDVIEQGLAVFIAENTILAEGPIATSIRQYIALMQNGANSDDALASIGMSKQVLEALVDVSQRYSEVVQVPLTEVPLLEQPLTSEGTTRTSDAQEFDPVGEGGLLEFPTLAPFPTDGDPPATISDINDLLGTNGLLGVDEESPGSNEGVD